MRELWRRLRWWRHRDEFESELAEEMAYHLAMKAAETGDADGARRQFGNTTLLKEESRAMWTWTFWEQAAQDLRYGLRTMAANKLFTAMAVLSLALGIGANAAIYSFTDAIMLRALPVKHPEELVILNWRGKGGEPPVVHGRIGFSSTEPDGAMVSPNFPYPAFEALREHNHVFSALWGYANAWRLNLVVDGRAVLREGQYVTGNYFGGLGVAPAMGRLIEPADDRAGAAPVAVLAHNFWQGQLGSRADVVGKTMLINGKAFTIVGVTPPEFFGVRPQTEPAVFLPVHTIMLVNLDRFHDANQRFVGDYLYWIEPMGRLKPGVTRRQAETEMAGEFAHWVRGTAKTDKERATLPQLWLEEGGSGVDSLRRQFSKPLMVLTAMVGLILIVACANLANLLLARATARRREFAVRLSLGAARERVMRQLLTESLLLAASGGTVGVLVAMAGIRALTALLANGQENFTLRAELDWPVLLFTCAVVVVTGVLFGLAPAIQATKVDVTPALKETRASEGHGRKRRFGVRFGLSHVLVVAQVGISLLLVAAAGLFVRTLENLHAVELGFNQDKLLVFSVDATEAGYKDTGLKNFYAELQRRLRAVPGVERATMTHMPLVADSSSSIGIDIPGWKMTDGQKAGTELVQVGPQFFETMQIPILAGRAIDERDREGAQRAVVVNTVFAEKYFPNESPVGRHFTFGRDADARDVEVMGVARATRYSSLKGDIPPVAYTSYRQAGDSMPLRQMYFELRTAGDPMRLANAVRSVVRGMNALIPVADVTTQTQLIDRTIAQERTFADLCTAFGGLALVMACVGLYGTMAYAVTRRTSEIGIRMALGANRSGIVWMVLREVLVLGLLGVTLGMAATWQVTTFLKSFLFGLKPDDPWTLGAALAILMACAVIAGYAPAWRASRIDPMTALRNE